MKRGIGDAPARIIYRICYGLLCVPPVCMGYAAVSYVASRDSLSMGFAAVLYVMFVATTAVAVGLVFAAVAYYLGRGSFPMWLGLAGELSPVSLWLLWSVTELDQIMLSLIFFALGTLFSVLFLIFAARASVSSKKS